MLMPGVEYCPATVLQLACGAPPEAISALYPDTTTTPSGI